MSDTTTYGCCTALVGDEHRPDCSGATPPVDTTPADDRETLAEQLWHDLADLWEGQIVGDSWSKAAPDLKHEHYDTLDRLIAAGWRRDGDLTATLQRVEAEVNAWAECMDDNGPYVIAIRGAIANVVEMCINGHPFAAGVDVDMVAEGRTPDPRWCNVCGDSRKIIRQLHRVDAAQAHGTSEGHGSVAS